MGWGRNMDGCGHFMKYSLFIVNLIIFVSKTFKMYKVEFSFLLKNCYTVYLKYRNS